MKRRTTGVALAVLLGLTSCASSSELPELDEPADGADRLPSSVSEQLVDLGSARLVSEQDDVSIWLAFAASLDRGVCIVVAEAGTEVATACGRLPVELDGTDLGSFSIGEPRDSDQWQQISESVWQRLD